MSCGVRDFVRLLPGATRFGTCSNATRNAPCSPSRPRTAAHSARVHQCQVPRRSFVRVVGRCSIRTTGKALPETSCSKAWGLLRQYTANEFQGLAQPMRDTKSRRDKLRDALQTVLVHKNPEFGWDPEQPQVLLGVVCSDVRLGIRALRDWSTAVGTKFVVPESQVPDVPVPTICGPVYIKYNSITQNCYVSKYQGQDRGVLLTIGQVQLGHFPLGLWDEEQCVPAPKL